MPNPPKSRRAMRSIIVCTAIFTLLLGAQPAFAHRDHIFAASVGDIIEGEIGDSHDRPLVGVEIRLRGPDGNDIALTESDAEGRFAFTAPYHCDYTIDANDHGHRVHYDLDADELPDSLPPFPSAAAPSPPSHSELAPTAPHQRLRALDETQIRAVVEEAVARQINPLRADIARYERTVRFHDILGGIGFILGLSGIAFFLLGARRRSPKGSNVT